MQLTYAEAAHVNCMGPFVWHHVSTFPLQHMWCMDISSFSYPPNTSNNTSWNYASVCHMYSARRNGRHGRCIHTVLVKSSSHRGRGSKWMVPSILSYYANLSSRYSYLRSVLVCSNGITSCYSCYPRSSRNLSVYFELQKALACDWSWNTYGDLNYLRW